MAHTDEQWAAIQSRAEKTHVADLAGGVQIVIAHPGQEPNMDPKYLRENFGVTPDMVITLDKSKQAPVRIFDEDPPAPAGAKTTKGAVTKAEHDAAKARIRELEAESDAKVDPDEHQAALDRIAELEAAAGASS